MEVEVGKAMKKTIRFLSIILLIVGYCGSPLIMRLYFLHGGSRVWLSTWLETAGFPILLIPLVVSYLNRRKSEGEERVALAMMKLPTFLILAIIGVFVGLANYLFAFGIGHLPVSTAALISSSQLAFTAVAAFLIVKQKFNSYTINAIALLIVAAVLLGIHASNDKPPGESNKMYALGFVLMILASLMSGALLPVLEFVYSKANQAINFTFVMEVQFVMAFFSTVFATVGMIINNDFKVIAREASQFGLGETRYYVILVFGAFMWTFTTLGLVGTVFCTNSLVTGILVTCLLPVQEVLAVIFYKEKFQAEKGIALALSLWGFVSYFYGEIKHSKKINETQEIQTPQKTPDLVADMPPKSADLAV